MNTRLPDADGTHRLGRLPNGVKLHVFEWPCEKRKAHGAHPIQACSRCDGRVFSSHPAPCDKDKVIGQCPGVKAHPKTMIGGKLL